MQTQNTRVNDSGLPYYRKSWVRWVILGTVINASILASVQSSALIVALVDLIVQLNANIITIIWVLMAYIIAITAAVIIGGPLADIFGKGKVYCAGYLIFTLGSLLCGVSQPVNKGVDLVGFRIVQGVGSGLLFSTSTALVVDKFIAYNQVGLTQGITAISFAIGSALGPMIGGGLALIKWYWIFFINVPFGGVGFIISLIFIRDSRKNHHLKDIPRKKLFAKFDWAGVILLAASISLILLVIVSAIFQSGDISKPGSLIAMAVIAVVCVVAFIIVELKIKNPVIRFPIFKNKNLSIPLISTLLASFVRGNINFGSIFLFQGPLLKDPLQAGILLIPFGVGTLLGGLPAGLFADVIGSKLLVILGPLIAAIGLVPAFVFKASYNYWYFGLALFLSGLGLGIFNSPNSRTIMFSIEPKDRGLAASLTLMLTMFSQSFSIILAFSVVLSSVSYDAILQLFIYANASELIEHPEIGDNFMGGIHTIFYITAAVCLVPFILGFFTDNIMTPQQPPNKPQDGKPANENKKDPSTHDKSSTNDKEKNEVKKTETKKSKDESSSSDSSTNESKKESTSESSSS